MDRCSVDTPMKTDNYNDTVQTAIEFLSRTGLDVSTEWWIEYKRDDNGNCVEVPATVTLTINDVELPVRSMTVENLEHLESEEADDK